MSHIHLSYYYLYSRLFAFHVFDWDGGRTPRRVHQNIKKMGQERSD
jgi:hypothetical protein